MSEETNLSSQKLSRADRKAELKLAQRKTAKPLLWIGIVSIVMLFAGLTSAYVVRADNGNWLIFQLPSIVFISTAIIITSSITMFLAQQAIKKNNYRLTSIALFLTLALGFGFFLSQKQSMEEQKTKSIYFLG